MRDRDRPLAARGHKDAPRMGAYMAHHALVPDHALVSPARRTRETWDGLARRCPAPPPVIYEDRLYDAGRRGDPRRDPGEPRRRSPRCWSSATIQGCTRPPAC